MTWTDPNDYDWDTGLVPTQTILRAHIRDNMLSLLHPVHRDTADVTFASNGGSGTTETTLFTAAPTIAAGSIGSAGVLRCELGGKVTGNGSITLTVKAKLGGTTLLTPYSTFTVQNTANQPFRWIVDIQNRSSEAAQWCEFFTQTRATDNFNTAAVGTATVDTSAACAFDVTAQWSSTSAGATITVSSRKVWVATFI